MARTSAVPGPQSRIARSISLHRLTQAQVQACRWYLMFRVGGRAQRRQRRTCKHQAGCTMAPDVLLLVSTPLTTDCHTNLMSAPLGSIRHGQLRSCPAPPGTSMLHGTLQVAAHRVGRFSHSHCSQTATTAPVIALRRLRTLRRPSPRTSVMASACLLAIRSLPQGLHDSRK